MLPRWPMEAAPVAAAFALAAELQPAAKPEPADLGMLAAGRRALRGWRVERRPSRCHLDRERQAGCGWWR
eukprot:COSAG06_NODE_4497_length_4202_cov_90.716549_4_plen_70_part_00